MIHDTKVHLDYSTKHVSILHYYIHIFLAYFSHEFINIVKLDSYDNMNKGDTYIHVYIFITKKSTHSINSSRL